jgi:HK97 family phage prohead protease
MPPELPTAGAILRFELAAPVTAADDAGDSGGGDGSRRRTIRGQAVPYGEAAVTAGDGVAYRFRPGSLRAARERVPVLLSHDMSRPVGVVASLTESESGAEVELAIDATPDGDHALVQARSGSRAGLSVGAAPLVFTLDGDVIEVAEAELHEVSLVPLAAYPTATVTSVQATAPPIGGTMPPESTPAVTVPAVVTGSPPAPALAASSSPPPAPALAASSSPPPAAVELVPARSVIVTEAARPSLSCGAYVKLLTAAQQGDAAAQQRFVQAALAESVSTDLSGVLPPTYERTILGAKLVRRPLWQAFQSKPLPGVGLQVNKPVWTTPPVMAWAATVDDDAHSTKVVIGSQSAVVARADWAGAISYVVAQRSDPNVIDETYAQAVQSFYAIVEAKIYGELGAAAPGVAVKLGAAIAEFYVATGNVNGPDVIIMAPDVWGEFADASGAQVAVAAGAASASDSLSFSFAGIPTVCSGVLPAGETILATRRAVDVRVSDPVKLTANAIGALNIELAAVGEGLFDTDYPAELLRFAAVTPLTALAASSSSSGSSSGRSGR